MPDFLTPFHYDYMLRAIWVSALIGGVCGFLSSFITLKGWSLMGDALSHAVVPGVALAYMFGLPFALGAFIAGLLAAGAMAQGFGAYTLIGPVGGVICALAIVAASRAQPAVLPTDGPPGIAPVAIGWTDLHPLVAAFWELVQARQDLAERHRPGRLKQWLNQLRRCHPQAEALYGELRVISDPKRITEHLDEAGRSTSHVSAFAESRQSPTPGCHRVA